MKISGKVILLTAGLLFMVAGLRGQHPVYYDKTISDFDRASELFEKEK